MNHNWKTITKLIALVSLFAGGYHGAFMHDYARGAYDVAIAIWAWEMAK